MLRKGLILLSVILLVFGIVGCSNLNSESNLGESNSNNTLPELQESETIYPLTFKDGTGTDVTLNSEPQRIISLMPSLTETLYGLGAGDKVVAVTSHDNYPEDVQENVEYVFEDALNPNIEQIINLKPDLILMGAYNEELTEKIRSLNIPVAKFDPQSINGVYQSIETVGLATNNIANSKELIAEMKSKEELIIQTVNTIPEESKAKVWVEVSSDLWTAGKGTFIDELVTKAGGINIVNEEGWIQYSEENIIAQNPQVILTTYGYYDSNAVGNVYKREGWQNLNAVKNNRVIDIDSDLVNRTGPRVIEGLEEVAKALYPNLFK